MLAFGLKLILSAIFIVGFYLITRGEWITKPDGSKEWVGKIFSFWSKFLQQHTIKRLYYSGDEWVKKMSELMHFFDDNDIIEVFDNGVVIQKMTKKRLGLLRYFCEQRNILFTYKEYGSGILINVYKEEKQFKIPFWISAPLGECITCVSSVWGSVMFVFWWVISKYTDVEYYNILSSMPIPLFIFFWASFCISLAFMNEILFYLNDRLKK